MAGERWKRLWGWLSKPSASFALGTLVVVGFVAGVIFLGGSYAVVESTNTLEFCISCHEMRDFVFEEYRRTVHYENNSGVRAVCADCHVPTAFGPKLLRKARATIKELPHKLLGSIGTREKFEARRLELAQSVWAIMKATDSRECRNCHNREAMLLQTQKPRARSQHEDARRTGETCIDCHEGVAHEKPKQTEQTEKDAEFTL